MSALRRFVSWNRSLSTVLAERYPGLFTGPSYVDEIHERIDADLARGPESVLEVGGIDRPLLTKGRGYRYVGVDIEEKPACHEIYDQFIVQSIEDPVDGSYDVAISFTLLEHVRDNTSSIRSILEALRPGGTTHHYIPSKWHPYAVALRAVGPKWQRRLIPMLRPAAAAETGYPTYFDHCSVAEMGALFRSLGFTAVDVRPYYRATDYFAFFLPAYLSVGIFEKICTHFGIALFASGFVISGRKPE